MTMKSKKNIQDKRSLYNDSLIKDVLFAVFVTGMSTAKYNLGEKCMIESVDIYLEELYKVLKKIYEE